MTRWYRDLLLMAAEAGLQGARIEHGGKHLKLIGLASGIQVRRVVPCTPGDRRDAMNIRRDLARAVRAAGA